MLITSNQCYAERFFTLIKAEKAARPYCLILLGKTSNPSIFRYFQEDYSDGSIHLLVTLMCKVGLQPGLNHSAKPYTTSNGCFYRDLTLEISFRKKFILLGLVSCSLVIEDHSRQLFEGFIPLIFYLGCNEGVGFIYAICAN